MDKADKKKGYHHGNLAESLLNAMDELATRFGIESVTLRGCAKLVGVSPSSAFRHYTDKRALLTAFATRALHQLSAEMTAARDRAHRKGQNPLHAVGMAYIEFALDKPAFFRAMWHEEAIYSNDPDYVAAAGAMSEHLQGGFADTIQDADPENLEPRELLAWSAVHGLASLFVDGPVAKGRSRVEKLARARSMLECLGPSLGTDDDWRHGA
jgi:AcrR family transcriptional regulator